MIKYIKPFYSNPTIQRDLRHDAVMLMSKNMTGTQKRLTGNYLSRREIKKLVDLFKESLNYDNKISGSNYSS